jgi:hypothetical protein
MGDADSLTRGTRMKGTNEQEAYEIGIGANRYLYSIVPMDATRRQAVNVEAGKGVIRGPVNAFRHVRMFSPQICSMSCG